MIKGETISVTGRGGPQVWETPRIPRFLDSRLTDGCQVVYLTRRPLFTPQKHFLIHISVRDWVNCRAIVGLQG
jgi:hypothetical protein